MSLLLAGCWLAGMPLRAVLFVSTGDPTFNTTAPTGALQDSGWQYEGQWGADLGTPIAPNAFITAKHVGGSVGDTFTFDGVAYTTTGFEDSPTSDLRIWRVNTPFPTYAPLYTTSDEAGQGLVVFGRGTQRGAAVSLNGNLIGWQYGASDNLERWGQNSVAAVVDGGAGLGQLLAANFINNGSPNEAHLSGGDSGGGVFLQQSGVWKLAGINYGVDGPFSFTGVNGSGFYAALFDARGLYVGGDGHWQPVGNPGSPVASSFYATRISANESWILAAVPEPASGAAAVGLGALVWVLALKRTKRFG